MLGLQRTGIADHVRGLKEDELKAMAALPSPQTDCSYLPWTAEVTEPMLREAHGWCFDGDDCLLT